MATSEAPEQAEAGQGKLSVAQILRTAAPQYVERYGQQAAPQVQSTLAKLSLCRTAALGGHRYRCDGCPHECVVYNSCGDRHCPQCAGAKRADWIDSTEKLLLDGVKCFQVVFTLPSELSSLALGNRKAIYDLLFTSAWSALKETIETEQGYDAAALMVLHTWNQKLQPHGHVHAVVPGGGPALDGSGWINSHRREEVSSSNDYLVDAVDLRSCYRDHFLAGVTRLREKGELKLQGDFQYLQADDSWQAFVLKLKSLEWVSFIEPPPRQKGGQACKPEQMLKYLARYLTGGPISDRRIIAADENEVTFWAREGKTTGGDDHRIPVTLPITEFTRRWSLHILPKGYTKTRRFGGWSNPRCSRYVERCAIMLEATDVALSADTMEFGPFLEQEHGEDCPRCPKCAGQMRLINCCEKPSWREVMTSPSRPGWYGHDSL